MREKRFCTLEAISKLGSIKALLFQTLFSTQLILEWKVPQIHSLQTTWNMETISCLFIFSLVPWCRCILLFFSPGARQVLLWRLCNVEFAFRSLLWLSSPLPWAVQATESFLIFSLLSKSSHWSWCFCILHLLLLSLSLSFAPPEMIYRFFRSAVFMQFIQALNVLGKAWTSSRTYKTGGVQFYKHLSNWQYHNRPWRWQQG